MILGRVAANVNSRVARSTNARLATPLPCPGLPTPALLPEADPGAPWEGVTEFTPGILASQPPACYARNLPLGL